MCLKNIDNNFKYLTQVVEEYRDAPVPNNDFHRKKRLLLLKNFNTIKDLEFIHPLLEGFISEHLYFLAIRDFFGYTVLERGGDQVLAWARKYYSEEAIAQESKGLFGAKDPPSDAVYYLKLEAEFRKRLKKDSNYVVIVSTEFKRITLNGSPPFSYARRGSSELIAPPE